MLPQVSLLADLGVSLLYFEALKTETKDFFLPLDGVFGVHSLF